ncbi:MAG: hypothetical protein HQK61_03870 [Desulfamplus sp.]|nr:hypothetical protein [Desulfamplus sp.]
MTKSHIRWRSLSARWLPLSIIASVLGIIATLLVSMPTTDVGAANAKVYYEPAIKNIILQDCSRCHSGPSRNLMDYDNLKAYADSGMLAVMVQGSMSRFAGNDIGTILDWIDSGAPEKPAGAVPVRFKTGQAQAGNTVYYDPAIKNIISNDCARCHSGMARNLMDYDNLKAYADSGMLAAMVQGSMSRFAGNDMGTILDWINSGAPEKPGAKPAGFFSMFNQPTGCPTGQQYVPDVPLDKITYNNTIQYVLARDCLGCHSDKFRNLTTYENVKMYADSGLLKSLVQRGGPMHRFAGPDTRLIVLWVDKGAPR